MILFNVGGTFIIGKFQDMAIKVHPFYNNKSCNFLYFNNLKIFRNSFKQYPASHLGYFQANDPISYYEKSLFE
jgi:hypothetical protein